MRILALLRESVPSAVLLVLYASSYRTTSSAGTAVRARVLHAGRGDGPQDASARASAAARRYTNMMSAIYARVEALDHTKGIKSVFVNKCAQGLGGLQGFRKASLVLLPTLVRAVWPW